MKIKKFLMDQKKNAKKVQENKKNLQEAREMELEDCKKKIQISSSNSQLAPVFQH